MNIINCLGSVVREFKEMIFFFMNIMFDKEIRESVLDLRQKRKKMVFKNVFLIILCEYIWVYMRQGKN